MSLGNGPRKKYKKTRQTGGKRYFCFKMGDMKVADSIMDWLGSGDKLDECYMKK